MERDLKIEHDLIDTIIETPFPFKIKEKRFYLYPASLGKMYLTSKLLEKASLSSELIQANPYEASLSYVIGNAEDACRVLCFYTLQKKEEIFDIDLVEERVEFFKENLNIGELTELFVLALTRSDIATFIKHLQIDKEKQSMKKVLACKKEENNNYSFGGLSVYGSLFDVLFERYHWSMDYVLWGISYSNIQMLMNDRVTNIYLTDEEKKKCRVSKDRTMINADDIKNIELIKQMA